ncbi:peroxidase 12-like [Primulina tabacum]|uniref:peroxidase 12-like n=1 Tax=Primulina tabacum TaxID=48773 RepID=UPI003F59F7FF
MVAMKDLQISIPPSSTKTDDMISYFAPKNFTITEMVVLSGAHMIGSMGLLASDENLNMDYRTGAIAEGFAFDRDRFASAMIKMSQLNVLTGEEGEIRVNCSARNLDNVLLPSAADETMKRGSSALFEGTKHCIY